MTFCLVLKTIGKHFEDLKNSNREHRLLRYHIHGDNSKKKKTEKAEEAEKDIQPKHILSPFNLPDLKIKIGNEILHVNRDQLMEVSPVFQTMLTGKFKEKNAIQIHLPDKDPKAFALFLRHTLPGFEGLILTDMTARLILPLADEYQTNTSLLKIDRVLAELAERKAYPSADELTDEILTAETYNLLSYLEVCIEKASKFSHKAFIRNPKFHCISDNAKSKLFLLRCKDIDLTIDKCMKVVKMLTT
ncbi:uncharacterized protein LOC127706711 [Mytilus californianus]|uniref:uncharacterized protein LOC127706711 n=1 Tax=Mytilus californianus TaxID=6549 RepID=UPI00224600DD|nr:uncharacterized protein LOC127706711 [Mytilus californianus]